MRIILQGTRVIVFACVAAVGAKAAMPPYLREALDHFNPEVPAGWAYTQTTSRNDLTLMERFDPNRPRDDRWTLLQYEGRAPSPDDRNKYRRFKESNPSAAAQAVFRKADIEPGSLELIKEDTERADFRCSFRTEAAGPDKMLGHLSLQLTVNKQQRYIEKFLLELKEAYSPVLGVKMNALTVEMSFNAPSEDGPSLPAVSTSRFTGRIFFIGMEENLQVSYSNFTRAN